jgi:hypothetical protein
MSEQRLNEQQSSEQRLREAFDRTTPSDEARQRMLSGILAAVEEVTPEQHKPRRRGRLLAFALPIACSLVILATVGALTLPQLLSDPSNLVSEGPDASASAPPSGSGSASNSADAETPPADADTETPPTGTDTETPPADADADTPPTNVPVDEDDPTAGQNGIVVQEPTTSAEPAQSVEAPVPVDLGEPAMSIMPPSSSPGETIGHILVIAIPVLTTVFLVGYLLFRRRKARTGQTPENKTEK